MPDRLKIDQAATELKTSRSSFARQAFEEALFRLRLAQMEPQDAAAYALQPQDLEEVTAWADIQDWGTRETRRSALGCVRASR